MRKSVGNRKIIISDEYVGGRKIGLERVKVDPNETGWDGVDWIHLPKDRNK
jgi:hypothetical protein